MTADSNQVGPARAQRFVPLGSRLVMATFVVLAIVTAAVYIGLSRQARGRMLSAKEQAASMAGELFLRFIATPVLFEDATSIQDALLLLSQDPEVLGVELWRALPGKKTGERIAAQLKEPGKGAPPRYVEGVLVERQGDRIILRGAIRDQDRKVIAVLAVQYSLAREDRAYAELRLRILVCAGAVSALLAILLWGVTQRWITGPLGRLLRAVRQVEAGEHVDLLTADGGDEVGRLAAAFVRMADVVNQRERDIVRRNNDMKLIMDNVAQGFLSVTRAGVLLQEHSAIVETWFGPFRGGETLWSYLNGTVPKVGDWIALLWNNVSEDLFPLDVALDQMPSRIEAGGRTLALSFRPIQRAGQGPDRGAGQGPDQGADQDAGQDAGQGAELLNILIVISDITAEIEEERARAWQQELVSLFQWIVKDRAGVIEFFAESERLVRAIVQTDREEGRDITVLKREIHTLKGNSGIFGLKSIVAVCQALEARFDADADADADAGPEPAADAEANAEARPEHRPDAKVRRQGLSAKERDELLIAWQKVGEMRRQLLGDDAQGRAPIEIGVEEHRALLEAVLRGAPREEIEAQVRSLTREPAAQRLTRIGEQVRSLARRLGKGEITVLVESNRVRLPDGLLGDFWGNFTHLVRNAVDHGLEAPEERLRAGKGAAGSVQLRTVLRGDRFLVEIEDDGRGIDWRKLAERARATGLPAQTRGDLVEALFADGISTRERATEISGRGVGMSAVRSACERTGGKILVHSEPGEGTRFQFSWPRSLLFE